MNHSIKHDAVPGVDQILRASDYPHEPVQGPGEDGSGDNSSPPRESNLLRNAKVSVVSPPEGEAGGRRGPEVSQPGYDMPTDSPYGPPGAYPPSYHGQYQYPHPGYYPPPASGKSHPASGERGAGGEFYPPSYHGQYPPAYAAGSYPYDRGYYEGEGYAVSPGKRPRVDVPPIKSEAGREGEESEEYPSHHLAQNRYPPGPGGHGPGHGGRPYYDRGGGYPYPYYKPAVSGSYDESESSPKRRAHPPPISKAPSYPPPDSPTRYGEGADGSAATYPGARPEARRGLTTPHRSGSDHSYGNPAIYSPRGAPGHGHARYEEGGARGPPPDYYRDSGYSGHPNPSRYEEHPGYGHGAGHEEHPLMGGNDDDKKMGSPHRRPRAGSHSQSVCSKDGSPNKVRPSTTAQAAIAAGMTEPASAKEVDFDVTDPPTEPILPPSTRPVCNQSSDINGNDVLCGRGGGTNTQVGNRRFRSLVQEFQPTYLLCRRKEKPLIARTIVLIIRNRGGRFLKKIEEDGTFLEVGDEKAEAKTSQALREGLDVRACRSSIDGKKKPSRGRKKKPVKEEEARRLVNDMMGESPHQTERPPPQHEGYGYPPPYYPPYGYDPYYPPPPGYGGPSPYSQSPYSPPQRKRGRGPPGGEPGYEGYSTYPPASPYKPYGEYHYPPENHRGYGPPPGHPDASREEENAMGWEMDFSPPRSAVKKHADGEN